jgi:protein gp37
MTYSTDPIDVADWHSLEFHEMCLALPRIPGGELEELRQSIVGSGLRFPIILFEGKILDGRHRFEICVDNDVEPRFETFMGPGSAMQFVIDTNLRRRHLPPEQRLHVITELSRIAGIRARNREAALEGNARGGKSRVNLPTTSDTTNVVPIRPEEPLRTRDQLANEAGVSGKTASDFLTVKEKGSQLDLEEVLNGNASISGKAKEVRERAKVERTVPKQAEFITLEVWRSMTPYQQAVALATKGNASLNEQGNESIGWAKWSWNPVTGCKHNCPYCYARDIANRFYEQKFEPSLIPSRLTAPQNHKPRASDDPAERNIFTCSMADLFGGWVPEEWIGAVMRTVEKSPDWNFLFLTKFPRKMVDRKVPDNAWLGTSVDLQARVKAVEDAFERVPAHTKWLSIEPLLEPLKFSKPRLFKWVVIGGASASTQTPKWQPPFDWVARLYMTFKDAGASVYLKDNIGPTLTREYPWQQPELKSSADVFHYLKETRHVRP